MQSIVTGRFFKAGRKIARRVGPIYTALPILGALGNTGVLGKVQKQAASVPWERLKKPSSHVLGFWRKLMTSLLYIAGIKNEFITKTPITNPQLSIAHTCSVKLLANTARRLDESYILP